MVSASAIWGLSGIFYAKLSHLPTIEILAHRIIWSMVVFGGYLSLKGRFRSLFQKNLILFETRYLLICAILISLNWFSFIFAIQTSQAVQASFGYYVFPIVAVFFGYLFKGERFSKYQKLAIFLVIASVCGLAFALRVFPLISVVIAITFGTYGLLKGYSQLGPIESVTIETMLLSPLALVILVYLFLDPTMRAPTLNIEDYIMLFLSGLLTGGPLILFSYATRILSYSFVGLLQYINPSLQFLVAIVIFNEPYNFGHSIALVLIWLSIAMYTLDSWRLESKRL